MRVSVSINVNVCFSQQRVSLSILTIRDLPGLRGGEPSAVPSTAILPPAACRPFDDAALIGAAMLYRGVKTGQRENLATDQVGNKTPNNGNKH